MKPNQQLILKCSFFRIVGYYKLMGLLWWDGGIVFLVTKSRFTFIETLYSS